MFFLPIAPTNPMPRTLLLQAYGAQPIFDECIYAVLSLVRHYETAGRGLPCTVVIYTDRPDALRPYLPEAVLYETLTAATIQEWRGAANFVHRVKIMMLLDYAHRNPATAILYADTDTVVERDLEPLFALIESGTYLVHTDEGRIDGGSNLLFKKLTKFLRKNPHFGIPPSTMMYNAGVLGLRGTDIPLLERVLNLTDTLYDAYPKHVMEQMAFSLVLQQSGVVATTDDSIYHYWNFKEFRPIAAAFFTEYPNTADRLAALHTIHPRITGKPKAEYEALPFWAKTLRKWRGKKY